MALMLRDPFVAEPFRLVDEMLNRVFGDGTRATGWVPSLDLTETEDEYVVVLDLPGVRREGVSIELTGRPRSPSAAAAGRPTRSSATGAGRAAARLELLSADPAAPGFPAQGDGRGSPGQGGRPWPPSPSRRPARLGSARR